MSNLKAKYLGLELENPIIAGASKLTSNLDRIKEIETAGAAAIVCNSLFEEQVRLETFQLDKETEQYSELTAEMVTVFPDLEHGGPKEHLFWLEKTKKETNIPVIGSLNCTDKETWTDYAKQIEETGVDALEINFFHTPKTFDVDGASVERDQIEVLKAVKAAVKIPVGVKLSHFYSNPLNLIKKMDDAGADGFVIFNRLFQPDMDVEKIEHDVPFYPSKEGDERLPLRYVGLLYDEIKADVAANTGILKGADVVKMILAGADVVQVVSTLYKNKIDYIKTMKADLENWMQKHEFASLDDFRGKLSRKNTEDPFVYKRGQYVGLLMKSKELMKYSK